MFTVVGIGKVNEKKYGRDVVGTRLFVTCEAEGVVGLETRRIFISQDKNDIDVGSISVGSVISKIYYDQNGYVDALLVN